MNADPDKYGSLIESYDQDFLSGGKKYLKENLDAYNLLKGWNKHQNPRGPTKVGLSFNNNGEEDGTTLANDGTKLKDKYTRCGCNGHKTTGCHANKHTDRTVLHSMGNIEEMENEVEEINESNEDVA